MADGGSESREERARDRRLLRASLGRDAVLYLEEGFVLIDSGLCPEAVESIADQVLAQAAAALVG